jgi:hypothetical protein
VKDRRAINKLTRVKEIDGNRLVFLIKIKHLVLVGQLILK